MKIIPGRKLIPASSINREIERFIRILGMENCKNKIADLDEQLTNESRMVYNKYYLKSKNPLLNELKEYFYLLKKGKTIQKNRTDAINSLFSKAVTVNMINRSLSVEGKKQLKANLLSNEVRPFLFEIQTMTHFLESRYSLEYNDLDNLSSENNNFEFTVKKDSFIGEVECKWKNINAGSKIRREQFYTLVDVIFSNIKLKEGSFRIDVKIENRFQIKENEIGQLGNAVAKSLLSGEKSFDNYDGLMFEFTILPNVLSAEDAEELAKKSQSGRGHYTSIGNENLSLHVIAESDTDDNIIQSIHRSLKKAEKQLSKKYPALITLYLQDINAEQFELIRTQSNLARLVTNYFKPPERNFIHTVSFTSYQIILKEGSNQYMQSPAVSWHNPNCSFKTKKDPFSLNI